MNRTHTLESAEFYEGFATLLDVLVPRSTTALVLLDWNWAGDGSDDEACEQVWDAVEDRFERVPDEDTSGRIAWQIDLEDAGDRRAFRDVVGLIYGILGQHFVYWVALRRDGETVLESVPHHPYAGIDAEALGEDVLSEVSDALDEQAACLVPDGTRIEWVAEGRRWSLRGASICTETLDGNRTVCYPATNLEALRIDDDRTTLRLAWGAHEFDDDALGHVLSWITKKVYHPPSALPCETEERAHEARELLAETLGAYDGRTL